MPSSVPPSSGGDLGSVLQLIKEIQNIRLNIAKKSTTLYAIDTLLLAPWLRLIIVLVVAARCGNGCKLVSASSSSFISLLKEAQKYQVVRLRQFTPRRAVWIAITAC